MDPLKNVSTRVTPQSEPVPGRSDMVANNAGGYGFAVDDWTRLHRFLVLGTTDGTYYVNERDHTLDNVEVVQRLAASDGVELVKRLVEVSTSGRAPKVNPTIYALAVACASRDVATKQAAFDAIPVICRTGTHLFLFAEYVQKQRGWGRGLRNAVARWYEDKPVDKVAYQTVKYRQREGWTHRDLLRLSHPKANGDDNRAALFNWIVGRDIDADSSDSGLRIIEGFKRAQGASHPSEVAKIIGQYGLPWETVPDQFLSDVAVWEAILDAGIGYTALMRNLGRLTRIGVIKPMASRTSWVTAQLTSPDGIKKGRVHPIGILDAVLTYQSGHGARGTNSWDAVSQITDALDSAFYLSFGAVEPTGKRTLLACDVSGSMGCSVAGSAVLSCRDATAALALVTAAVEPNHHITAFSDRMVPLSISPRQRLDDVVRTMAGIPFGRTDCALPMLYAMQQGMEVDVFVSLTDSETWYGAIHPFQALQQYRQKTGINAKLVVVGMATTGFTIADPSDVGMMDVCGFDTATPQIIADFSVGRI